MFRRRPDNRAAGSTIRYVCIGLLTGSSVLLVPGILVPTIRIEMVDPLSSWLGSGFHEFRANESELSIAGVIAELHHNGSHALAFIILAFSIVFPVSKLLVMWSGALNMWLQRESSHLKRALWLSDKLGKWSLLDVFVIAVAVVTLKQFPGGVRVTLGGGVWLFGCSIVLAMLGSMSLHRWNEQRAACDRSASRARPA